MAGVFRLQRAILPKLRPIINARYISTSKKNNETITVEKAVQETTSVNKNWVSYGFESKNEEADRSTTKAIFFISVTVCLVLGGYWFAYIPDYNLRDWSRREAYLELRRREENGLPLIDPNLVNPKHIHLPCDEDLEETEIII